MTTDPLRYLDPSRPRALRLACTDGDLGTIVPEVDAYASARRTGATVDELTDLEATEAIERAIDHRSLTVETVDAGRLLITTGDPRDVLLGILTPAGTLELYGGPTNDRLDKVIRLTDVDGDTVARAMELAR